MSKSKRANVRTRPFELAMIHDVQAAPGRPDSHMEALGNYLADKRPDAIVHIGDQYDMPTLAVHYHKPGSKFMEGRRVRDDIAAGDQSLAKFQKPINVAKKKHGWRPAQEFHIGNHEQRIERIAENDPNIAGDLLGYHSLGLAKLGWRVHPFLQPNVIGGVSFAHYFYNPKSGRPFGGMLGTRLKTIGFSFAQGHEQGFQFAIQELSNGTRRQALVGGSFYQHHEEYRGPQATNEYQGISYMHELRDGQYDLMQVSLPYLLKNWL